MNFALDGGGVLDGKKTGQPSFLDVSFFSIKNSPGMPKKKEISPGSRFLFLNRMRGIYKPIMNSNWCETVTIRKGICFDRVESLATSCLARKHLLIHYNSVDFFSI